MKKFYIFFPAACLLLLALPACRRQLDLVPISDPNTELFYASPTDFTKAVNAVYNGLRPFPDRQLNLSETRSDNLYAVSEGGVRDWDPVNNFHKAIGANPYVSEPWAADFNAIFRANKVLEQLELRSAVIPSAAQRTQIKAETRFLRAFFYFDLVRWYGRVPLITRPVLAPESFTIKRSPVSEVYNLIISDLKFAADSLPDVYPTTADRGRARKWAAKGLLALVHMTRSGPTYGIMHDGQPAGPGLGVNEWSDALKLLNEIIASTRFSFVTPFSSIFSYTNENNPEVVFDIQYITGANPQLGATFPWVLVPDAWFQSQGKPVQGGLTIRPVSNDLLNSFESGDLRKDFSIQQGYTFNGVPESRPFIKKYVDLTRVPASRTDWPINFIVMRYTDVLMLKAECILKGATPGTQSEVDAIVTQVRQRAGLGPRSGVTLSQLMEEKRKEFVGEGRRWHDLVRTGLVESVMNTWIQKEDVQNQIARPFNLKYVIYPVPQGERDVQVGLYEQNPDY